MNNLAFSSNDTSGEVTKQNSFSSDDYPRLHEGSYKTIDKFHDQMALERKQIF